MERNPLDEIEFRVSDEHFFDAVDIAEVIRLNQQMVLQPPANNGAADEEEEELPAADAARLREVLRQRPAAMNYDDVIVIEDDEIGVGDAPRQNDEGPLVKLEAGDGSIVTVPRYVACRSQVIRKMLQDLGIDVDDYADVGHLDVPLSIPHCDGVTLQKLMEYRKIYVCRHNCANEYPKVYLTAEDNEYLDVTNEELLRILMGATSLEIQDIIDICTQKIASMATGKTVEEIRDVYGLENDFSPEEEQKLRNRLSWVDL